MSQNYMSQRDLVWLISSFVLLAPPLLYIFVRNAIKIHRQGIVKDLSVVFNLPGPGAEYKDDGLIPSFEFVKYKYFLGRNSQEKKYNQEDFSWWAWLTGLLALALVLSLLGYAISRFGDLSIKTILGSPIVSDQQQSIITKQLQTCEVYLTVSCKITTTMRRFESCEVLNELFRNPSFGVWMCGVFAASAGSYVFMMRNFFRAVNNFDFGPASYISAAKDFIVSVVAVSILYFGLRSGFSLLGNEPEVQRISGTTLIILAFSFGLLPGTATRTLMDRSKLTNFKRENPDLYRRISVTPVEIVDGIDSEIRDRLADHHIHSTQNLATANPLMLFVETPYGVYQIMDWVAQAQLCCSVGPDKLVQFWKLGIRTLFDLERAALNRTYKSSDLLLAIGAILFTDQSKEAQNRQAVGSITEALVIASIQVKLDDPHVHRLRQIYIKVGERLGEANRRFGVHPKPDMNGTAETYFMWLKRWIK